MRDKIKECEICKSRINLTLQRAVPIKDRFGSYFDKFYRCKNCKSENKIKPKEAQKQTYYKRKTINKKCLQCNKEFEAINKVQKYCRTQCQWASSRKKNSEYIKDYSKKRWEKEKEEKIKNVESQRCPVCDKVFKPLIDTKSSCVLFCSKQCGKRAHYRRKNILPIRDKDQISFSKKEHICIQCETKFESISSNQKYCTKECGLKAERIKSKAQHISIKSERFCVKCFKMFLGNRNQIFCTKKCRSYNGPKVNQFVCQNSECKKEFENNRYKRACCNKCDRRIAYLKKQDLYKEEAKNRYWNNRDELREKSRIKEKTKRQNNREKIRNMKLGSKCLDCNMICEITDSFHFDHVRGEKIGGISELTKLSWHVIEKELPKCELVCAVCHAKRTAARRG